MLANVTTSAIATALGVSWVLLPTSARAGSARILGLGVKLVELVGGC